MSLSLPADMETFVDDFDEMHGPGCYALVLSRPDDLGDQWDRRFDVRPEWFDEFRDAERVVYLGASKDVLGRLEDHRNGDKRKAALLRVCDIDYLRNVWWFDHADEAFERESGIATTMQQYYPETYVHQR